jgi:hypothetical protein
MKYVKMLSLALVAASALMAFVGAGTASATRIYCGATHCPAGTDISATLKTGSTAILETTGGTTLVTCSGSTVAGKTSNTGSSTETVKGPISTLSWSGCTNTVNTIVKGELEIHSASPTNNGTLTAKSTQVTVDGIFGESCIYGAGAGLNLGTVVGGSPASISISALVPLISGGGFCPKETRWTANYTVTKPNPLTVHAS